MCMSKITKTYKPPLLEEREAWKVFSSDSGNNGFYYGTYFGPYGDRHNREYQPYRVNRWYKAVACPEITEVWGEFGWSRRQDEKYTTGFHVFPDKTSAERYRDDNGGGNVCRVIVRGIRHEGEHLTGHNPQVRFTCGEYPYPLDMFTFAPCWVADEMYIPEES